MQTARFLSFGLPGRPGRLVRALCFTGSAVGPSLGAQAPPERIDYLTFSQGAIPLTVSAAATAAGVTMDKALSSVDGNPTGFTLSLRMQGADGATEITYALPALTTFDRFAVPNVLETPSPGSTFSRIVEVHGSASSPTDGFALLGSATLTTHPQRGQVTELTLHARTPVRWVKLRLVGGINVQRDQMFYEFSEIVGNGTQEPIALATHFTGAWQGRGVQIGLRQQGAVVSGCYDGLGSLSGTVTGNILRATGQESRTGVKSLFVLTVVEDTLLRGVRSTNGAPFRLYTSGPGPQSAARCPTPPPPALGCNSVIHGIGFGFDSAVITPESEPVLSMLYDGLRNDPSTAILLEGHTSSEGTEAYNLSLSQRRAAAVVADLVRRGIPAGRLRAAGIGEAHPIATNDDESGRSLNRRVEVRCT
ncbi:MAG: OmpA family protein [Gemmatimonadetes bacterium]|nr:OmpA family protein [Gemmatimonadota bacterium]